MPEIIDRMSNGVGRISLSLLPFGTAVLSRYGLQNEAALLAGGHYNRSIIEHGLEAVGMTLYVSGISKVFSPSNETQTIANKVWSIGGNIGYVLMAFALEASQYQSRGYFQTEQFLGTLGGFSLGILGVALLNRSDRSATN